MHSVTVWNFLHAFCSALVFYVLIWLGCNQNWSEMKFKLPLVVSFKVPPKFLKIRPSPLVFLTN